jgi:hypothetical protein
MSEELKSFEISASDEVFNIDETDTLSALTKNPKQSKTKEAIGAIPSGAIGIKKAEDIFKKTKDVTIVKVKPETVAIHSTKNVSWPEIGKVLRGYNIVEKEIADKWLTRKHIRLATPEEVAREFGVI